MSCGWPRAPCEAIEYFDRRTARIRRRFDHDWRHRADQHELRGAPSAVPRHVARRLAAARGMSHMDDVTEIERGHDRCDIGRA